MVFVIFVVVCYEVSEGMVLVKFFVDVVIFVVIFVKYDFVLVVFVIVIVWCVYVFGIVESWNFVLVVFRVIDEMVYMRVSF